MSKRQKYNNKKFALFILIIIFILIIASNINALGVAPARVLFEKDQSSREGTIRVLNNQHVTMKLAVYVAGDNNELVKLDKESLTFEEDEYSKEVNFKVSIPQTLGPGRHEISIIILELPSKFNNLNNVDIEHGSIFATTSVASIVLIDVPYPGKYINSRLSIDSGNSGDQVTFAVSLFGKGDQDISNAKATIIIKGSTNEEITRLETTSSSIKSGEDTKLVATWDADVPQGLYYADAIIYYDGKQSSVSEVFTIGDKNLKIRNVVVDKFTLGQIAKVDVIAESVWNNEIKDVYAEIDVLDEYGKTIETVKTATVNVPAFGNVILSGYWDTLGMSIGDYDLNVKLYYEKKISEKLFVAVINMDNIQISDTTMIAGKATSVKQEGFGLVGILIIAVIVLIVINVVWLVYFKKFRKPKQNVNIKKKENKENNIKK